MEKYYIESEDLIRAAVRRLCFVDSNAEKIGNQQLYLGTKEYVVFCLGSLLKALFYQQEDCKIKKECISEEKLDELYDYVNMLREFNEIIQSWMYGEVEIEVDEKGISITELPGNNAERLVSVLNFWDIKDMKSLNAQLDFCKKGRVSITSYRGMLKSKIREYFYTNDFQEKYLGLRLCDWITVYVYFEKIALRGREKTIIALPLKKIKFDLRLKGFDGNQIEIILNSFIFSKKSKDLFDAFLIKRGEVVYLIPPIYNFIDPSRCMMSLFGGQEKDTEIATKGRSFETYIYSLLKSARIKGYKNITANENGEKYEIDIVFELDNILFLCECKTQSQHHDMRSYFRNRRELENYLEKFRRNYNFFTKEEKGIQIIKERIKSNKIKKCIPVFISNIVYTETKIDDIFITDEARIYRYLKRIPARVYIFNPQNRILYENSLFDDFYQGEISANQFLTYMGNKDKEIELEYKRIKLIKNGSMSVMGIYSQRYIEDKSCNYLV